MSPTRLVVLAAALLGALALLVAGAASAAPRADFGDRAFKSGPIQVSADGRWVWAANALTDSVYRIDARDFSVRAFLLPEPATVDSPRGLSVREDGEEVWVAAHDTDRVYVLDGATGAIRATIQLPWGSGPYSVALSRPDPATGRQRWALVTLHRANRLAAIDTATREVLPLGEVFVTPHGIVFTEDGTSAWVNHLLVTDEHPQLVRVDLTGERPYVATRIGGFAASPQHNPRLRQDDAAKNVAEGGYLNFRGHPAQIPSSTGLLQLWLPTQYHNMHAEGFTPDSTVQVSLRRLDLAARRVLPNDKIVLTAPSVHDPAQGHENPRWLGWGWDAGISGAVDIGFARLADRVQAVVLAEQSDELVVLPWNAEPYRSATDRGAPKLPELRVGSRPMGLALSPTEPTAYVLNELSMDVSVVDLTDPRSPRETRRVSTPLTPGLERYPLSNPELLRGAKLFYTSADPRISSNEKVACASCHINGESDGRSWSMHNTPPGTAGQRHGPRATLDLLGLGRGFTNGRRSPARGWGLLHVSGDRDEVQDFEHTIQGPQMGGMGFLGDRVQPELGPPNAGRDADLDALSAYLLSVPPLKRSPYRAEGGRLSDAAMRGATYFMGPGDDLPADARCATCHVPETQFQDDAFHDVGARRPAEERELNEPALRGECLWCAATPSLVGAFGRPHLRSAHQWATSIPGLFDDFLTPGRPRPHGRIGEMTIRQRLDLAEFVLSLDGNLDGRTVPGLRDTAPPRIVRVAPTSRTRVEVWFDETVDAESAGNPANYRLVELPSGAARPVTAARFDAQNGDRVTLTTALAAGGRRYRLAPAGPIRDAADDATNGVPNAIAVDDPRNAHEFVLGEVLTITLGASGYENLTIDVKDAAPIGPNLAGWGADRPWVYTTGGGQNPGLVRFEWRAPFVEATGVRSPDDLVAASFSLLPTDGDAQPVEVRRVLQGWGDPDGRNDYNSNPVGGPTWNSHRHPDQPWNRPGAQALGGLGDRVSDYDGAFDLAERVDAVVEVRAVNQRATFGGDRITQAYRFWLANPDKDYGHALRLVGTPGKATALFFFGADTDLRQKGPVLTLTYRLEGGDAPTPPATPAPSSTATRRPCGEDCTPTPTPTRRPCGEDCTPTPTPTPRGCGDDCTPTPTPTRRGCGDDCTPTPTSATSPERPDEARLFLPWAGREAAVSPPRAPGRWTGAGTGGLAQLSFALSDDGQRVCQLAARAAGCPDLVAAWCVPIDAGRSFVVRDASGWEVRGRFTSATTAEGSWAAAGCAAGGRWIADGP